MLQDAFGRERDVADLIADIKNGMSPADQEAVCTELQATPTLNKFMAELVRFDTIRGPKFNAALASGAGACRQDKANVGRQSLRGSPYPSSKYPGKSGTQPPKQPLAETYNPKELMMRSNPMTPNAAPQWLYRFPNKRIIFLSSPCTKCGGKRFNFECTKPKPAIARAACMTPENPWNESMPYAPDEMYEGEDELAVAYIFHVFYEPHSHGSDTYHTTTNDGQIMDEPWDELSMKKENCTCVTTLNYDTAITT
jgi:hypothetical protein